MAFLVRCPCCAAPKRIDPQRAWEPEVVECPRCASGYEACAGHGLFTFSERGPWTRFLGASPTMLFAMEVDRQRGNRWLGIVREHAQSGELVEISLVA